MKIPNMQNFKLFLLFSGLIFFLYACKGDTSAGDYEMTEEDTVTSKKYAPEKEDVDIGRDEE